MTALTAKLHRAFLDALGGRVVAHSELRAKPLDVDLALPLPPLLRLYMYTLVVGGTKRAKEFKAVLRVSGQRVGEYASFEFGSDRLTLLVAFRTDLNVFVLWDASLHARFKHGGNIQVREAAVHEAAATGWAVQRRDLTSGVTEVVYVCRPSRLRQALVERVASTGGERTA